MNSGDRFGSWTLVGNNPIGEGGNGVVWQATGAGHKSTAIKFLTRFDRYARFKDEIRFQQEHSAHPGILPLLDAYLPLQPSKRDRPWLVTPLALGVKQFIEAREDKLTSAVRVIHEVAHTLADVHALDAAHRDIKPDNLFVIDGRGVIGDFGLVSYVGKDPLTVPGERLGPIHYVAPELIGNIADPTDFRPGDIYALGKTLWVLGSGQRYPLPGCLSSNEPATQLSSYVTSGRAILLDRLLDSATQVDPSLRPNASEFAAELKAWLADDNPTTGPLQIDLPTAVRLQQLNSEADQAKRRRGIAIAELQSSYSRLHTELVAMGEQIAKSAGLNPRSSRLPDGNTNSALHYFPYRLERKSLSAGNRCFHEHFKTVSGLSVSVSGYAVLETTMSGYGLLQGGLVIGGGLQPPEVILRKEYEFPIGSALQEAVTQQFISELRAGIPPMMQRLAEILEENRSTSP